MKEREAGIDSAGRSTDSNTTVKGAHGSSYHFLQLFYFLFPNDAVRVVALQVPLLPGFGRRKVVRAPGSENILEKGARVTTGTLRVGGEKADTAMMATVEDILSRLVAGPKTNGFVVTHCPRTTLQQKGGYRTDNTSENKASGGREICCAPRWRIVHEIRCFGSLLARGNDFLNSPSRSQFETRAVEERGAEKEDIGYYVPRLHVPVPEEFKTHAQRRREKVGTNIATLASPGFVSPPAGLPTSNRKSEPTERVARTGRELRRMGREQCDGYVRGAVGVLEQSYRHSRKEFRLLHMCCDPESCFLFHNSGSILSFGGTQRRRRRHHQCY